ncbi:MAG: TetR/AcrR family transcriptional regulator [bacterium]
MDKTSDNRRARGETTKLALMRAAEKLIAEHRVENVSIREIVAAAGQKNESALQYHFKNLRGLLRAIRTMRSEQVQARRAELLDALLAETNNPSLQQLCSLMVEPTYQLARGDVNFRRYIKAFGHELALLESSPLKAISNSSGGGKSGQQIGRMLRQALPHLDEEDFRRRMDSAIMLCATSMYHHARQKNAFRGHQSELFLHSLLDALFGLLSAPVSPDTLALKQGV